MQNKLDKLQNAIIENDVPQMAAYIVSHAVDMRSSDIHIEPAEYTVRIRFRVDGVLRQIVEYPPNLHPAVTSRLKIMSNLKIDENRIPQDGRIQITTKDGKELDLRTSTLPTVYGEKIVMRIQDRSREIPTLDKLGIENYNLSVIKKTIAYPNGIVLTTGPTGSGKTTTLYACLNILNTSEVNIMTIEDPVEIQIDGLNQSQVYPAIDYSFAFGLRTGLRQDPDIIMVGEIRDKETINVSVEAALTGHLVLSTIHTNSAVSTLTRILNMGIPTFLITATINSIISQRLVRRICEHCKEELTLGSDAENKIRYAMKTMNTNKKTELGITDPETHPIKIYHGKGCPECGDTGYMNRIGLYEVMEMDNKLRRKILDGATELEIEEAAIAAGMTTLEQDGVGKILQGITTPEEVYTVARAAEDQ